MDPSPTRSSAALLLSSALSQALVLLLLLPPQSSSASLRRKRMRPSSPAAASSVAPAAAPDQFRMCFRMSSTFEWLSALLEPLLDSGPDLLPSARLAVALFRLASGCPYAEVARMFGVSESAARSCTKRLCRVLCTNFRFWLAFPDTETDLRAVSDAFLTIPGPLPGCCGAIASTRFPVPVQIVAGANCRILSISAGYGWRKAGSWTGLQCSSLYRNVEDGKLLGQGLYLVGGDEFPLLPWVMVPYQNAEAGTKEAAFNIVHKRMMVPVARTLRSLRGWGVLRREMVDEERRMAVACIGTCAILHNVLLMREDDSALSGENEDWSGDSGNGNGVWSERDGGLGGSNVAKEAADLRNTLAEKARDLWESNHQQILGAASVS